MCPFCCYFIARASLADAFAANTSDERGAVWQTGMCVQTCKVFVDKALKACVSSIEKARAQCDGVMDALSDVYSHARGVLDRLNADRWAPTIAPRPLDKQPNRSLSLRRPTTSKKVKSFPEP